MKKYLNNIITRALILAILFCCSMSCIEELPLEEFNSNQDISLVIEATFTDEVKHQEVFLSRMDLRLDLETDTVYNPFITPGLRPTDSVNIETDAVVVLNSSTNQSYFFTEGRDGHYISNQQFALENDQSYTLEIVTSNGSKYISDKLEIAGTAEVTNVYAERAVSDSGVDGVAIYIDASPITGQADYFRIAYDETYKIVAPLWDDEEFVLTNYDPCALPAPTYDLEIVQKDYEDQVCYNTVSSNTIDVYSTNNTETANVKKQLVRFIGRENFIISHRYSILVKQYVESVDAFSFFQALDNFSQSESVLSQVQPGTLQANVTNVVDQEELVLGYVDAVSVSEKRLFFNYTDFFPNEDLPPYPFNCNLFTAPESHLSYCYSGPPVANPCPQSIIESVSKNIITYYGPYQEGAVPFASCISDYIFTPRICGDCRLLGKNVEPEFWIEN